MLPSPEMMNCPNLAVPTEVMQHVVHVESGHNPFAIGVVGGQLVRQPQNIGEAIATVRMLEEQGYNFSVGIAQVNRANLGKYGLDSYEQAFDACANLAAGSRILAECYASAGNDWGKAFSCYYSGNFIAGYRDGYVQKVYDSIGQSLKLTGQSAMALPVTAARNNAAINVNVPLRNNSYRVAFRSVALDAVATAAIAPVVAQAVGVAPERAASEPGNGVMAAPSKVTAASSEVFVPQVRGPNDPVTSDTPAAAAMQPQIAASSTDAVPADPTDLHQGDRDEAFVF